MPEISAYGFMGAEASEGLFGANVLATRSSLEQGGDYDRIIETLGVGNFRYPGGSLTELYFDITNPNASIVTDRDTGEMRSFIPLDEALGYAAQEGLSVTVVIPTRNLLSDEVDANGDRFPAIDESALRGFVRDVVTGVHGDADIESFELGNEYWGSGRMSSVEYGRLASEMAVIIDDELARQGSGADIIVQSGANFDFARLSDEYPSDMAGTDIIADLNLTYGLDLGEESLFSSGSVNWTHVANRMILEEFDTDAERAAVDQIALHVYSRGQVNESQRSFFLNATEEAWSVELPEARLAVTEWNTAGNSDSLDRNTDFGLFQAHEMLNVMEEFLRFDVETAHVWPLIQNTPNALSIDNGQAELSPGGAMFGMMQQALPGKIAIDLTEASGPDTEVEEEGLSLHAFWEPEELLLYIAATDEAGADTEVDFSGLARDAGQVEISVLTVDDGAPIGSSRSNAVIEELDADLFLDGSRLSVQMDQGEIMQVRMFGFTPSSEFQDVISREFPDLLPEPMVDGFSETADIPASDDQDMMSAGQAEDLDASADTISGFPQIPTDRLEQDFMLSEEQQREDEDAEEDDDSGGIGDLSGLLLLFPFLGFLSAFA